MGYASIGRTKLFSDLSVGDSNSLVCEDRGLAFLIPYINEVSNLWELDRVQLCSQKWYDTGPSLRDWAGDGVVDRLPQHKYSLYISERRIVTQV